MTKVGVIAIAMVAGTLVGYVGCQMPMGLAPWAANAIGAGTSAGVSFALWSRPNAKN